MGYHYSYGGLEPDIDAFGDIFGGAVGMAGVFAAIALVFYLLMFAYAIVCYILQSLGIYAIAKRRGIQNPWLCWLPVGDIWIMGSISDQYQYIAKGKVRNRRKVLLGMAIAGCCAGVLMGVLAFVGIVGIAAGSDAFGGALLAVVLLLYITLLVMAIVSVVLQFIVLYDIYASCNPDNAVLFLVLSIFLRISPFLIFYDRKQDEGMPPRKVLKAEPVAEPEHTTVTQ